GLNTGLVVVASIGDNLRMDYTAVGDTTNLAARMLTLAEPGQIVIAEDTHRVVSGYFVTQSLGERAIKGKAEPVNAYEVVRARGLRTRLEVGAERGLTPFVGREPELIGIGGGLATSPLPHHRTDGSRLRRVGGCTPRREDRWRRGTPRRSPERPGRARASAGRWRHRHRPGAAWPGCQASARLTPRRRPSRS